MKGSQSVVGGGAPHRERPCELSLSELSPQPSHPSSSTPQTVPLETKTQVASFGLGPLNRHLRRHREEIFPSLSAGVRKKSSVYNLTSPVS